MPEVRLLAEEPDPHRVLRRAWPHLRPQRNRIVVAVGTTLASTAALALVPVVIGLAVDALLDRDRERLLTLAGITVGLVLLRTVLLQASEYLLSVTGERVVRDLRDTAVHRVSRAPLRFVEEHRGGDLLQRTTTEIADLAAFVRGQLPDLLSVVGYLVFSVLLLLSRSWELMLLLVVVFLPPTYVIVRGFQRAAERAFPERAQAEAAVAATFAESLDARDQLQIAGATAAWERRLARDTDRRQGAVRQVAAAVTWLDGTWLAQAAATAALLAGGGLLVGRGTVTVGVVVTFVLAARDLFSGVDDLAFVAGDLVESRVGLARLLDLLDATGPREPGCPAPPGLPGPHPTGDDGALATEAVTYAYQPGRPVLHGVDVVFAAGERAGIVGRTGSGKTTLVKLLAGLYHPGGGSVRIGRDELIRLDPAELRRRIVLVPQQVYLVTGTLAENLALTPGRPDRARMEQAVARLGLTPWVDGLAAGLDAPLGARGSALSAGERQLVGLLRAALVDPDVLLLDEATADLDPATALRIETALDRLHDGRTLLVVAHRPATVARLPRAVRMAAGKIEED